MGEDFPRIIEDLKRRYEGEIAILEAQLKVYRDVMERTVEEASEPNPNLEAYTGVR